MEDNRDFERAARSKIGPAGMEPPRGAWSALSTDLDRKQAAMLKRKAGRLKRMAVVLLLLLVGFVSFHFLTVNDGGQGLAVDERAVATASPQPEAVTVPASEDGAIPDAASPPADANTSPEHVVHPVNGTASGQMPAAPRPVGSPPAPDRPVTKLLQTQGPAQDPILSLAGPDEPPAVLPPDAEPVAFSPGHHDPIATAAAGNTTPKVDSAETADPGQAKSRFTLAVYFAPEYAWNGLKDNTDDQFDDAAMYNGREHPAFSYSTGIALAYALNDTWSLVSGVRYASFAKSMSVPAMYAENGDDGMHLLFSTSNGVVNMPFDDSHPGVHAGDSVAMPATCRQRLTFIHVPLMVRWQTTGKPLSWYANAGVSVNFIARQKATVSMDGGETFAGNRLQGLETMNFGLLAGAGIRYQVSDGLGLFAEPVFRASISSITRNMAVDSYPHSLGLNVGMLFHF